MVLLRSCKVESEAQNQCMPSIVGLRVALPRLAPPLPPAYPRGPRISGPHVYHLFPSLLPQALHSFHTYCTGMHRNYFYKLGCGR